MAPRGRIGRSVVVACAVALTAVACSADDGEGAAGTSEPPAGQPAAGVIEVRAPGRPPTGVQDEGSGVVLETTSTYPAWVTGGEVAVRVTVPAGVAGGGGEPTLEVDGEPRDGVLVLLPGDADATWVGLVDELPAGTSTLTARVGDVALDLEVTDHPVTGPLFSGPHQEPFACTVEAAGLGEPLDEDCSVEPVTTWRYRTGAGEWLDLEEGASVPADAATTATGAPFVVRTERGTINRGIYELHWLDPSVGAPGAAGSAGSSTAGWNGRLVYRFGGGCGTTYSQGSNLVDAFDPGLLEAGYAIAANTLTTFQTACNDVLSAETALMVRERFAEVVAPPELTIGDGGSGGAIQQLLIAQNYPGILDGITPSLPFPDAISIAAGITDCGLLLDWYATAPEAEGLTDEQRTAINGHAVPGTCQQWSSLFLGGIDPTDGCALPAEQVYDPDTNPDGARCTLQDSNVNLLGRDPETGFARRPVDNVGVQYGLEALLDGAIDVDTFLALNEGVGGYDLDGTIVEERHEAPVDAMEVAYAKGRVLSGAGLQASQTPILATTTYLDPRGDIHDRFRIYSVRARMQDVGADPTLLAISSRPGRGSTVDALVGSLDAGSAVEAMDRLLSLPPGERAVMTDTCTLPDGTASPTTDPTEGACAEAYPLHGDPRTAAGAPMANDVLKCTTRTPAPADYGGITFTDEQWERLLAAFPDGICDWTVPGVGQVPLEGTWLQY